MLAASPFPIGVDGYFYPIQVRSLLEHGTLAYPASPLAFWFMAPFATATDPIVGAKLAAALGGALIAIPAYLIGARLGKGRGPGMIAATLATMSASSAFLSLEFVKQGIGLTVAASAMCLALRAIEVRSRPRVVAATIAILAALLTHKVAAALVILVAAPAALAGARATGALRGRRLRYVCAGAGIVAVTLVILGVVSPHRFISAGDLGLVSDLFTPTAHWDAPALGMPGTTLAFHHEALAAGVLAMLAMAVLIAARRRAIELDADPGDRVATWVIALVGVGIALPWLAVTDPQGLAFRLRLSAFVPLALCAAVVARAALVKLPELHRDLACLAIAAVLAWHASGYDRTEGEVLVHPALVTAALALEVPSNATVIIPERRIAFMVAWYTRAKFRLRPERVPYPQRMRLLLPLSPVSKPWHLARVVDAARREPSIEVPIGVHPRNANGFVLVTEPTWDWMLAHMPDDARRHFTAWPTI